MDIAGREEEMAIFEELLHSPDSEFLAVTGRRRVGKTFLIRNYFNRLIVFDCSGLHEQSQLQQLENFCDELKKKFPKLKTAAVPATWLQAFNLLKEYIDTIKGDSKKIIFLDELPWFETPRSGFKAALDNFWNNWCTRRNDIILIICGSAASWIMKNIINDRGGFHNRITRQIKLQPFTLAETKYFLRKNRVALNEYDILQLYMVLGGIPFYLKEIKPGKSVDQIIDGLFFQRNSLLKNEFQNLYASLFKNYQLHEKVVKVLASKDSGLTRAEIMAGAKFNSGGGFSTILQELEQSGFISVLQPFANIRKETLYRLRDEYTLFYFKFLYQKAGATGWMQKAGQQSFKIWCGHSFENICLKHMPQIKKALGIQGIYTQEASWWYKGSKENEGVQIDLLIDRADQCINICEMKFYNTVFEITKGYAAQLQKKKALFEQYTKTKKNIFITLITTYGLVNNAYKLSVVSNEMVMDVLFTKA
jgi:AAA+ ATPase superfamily predicted ATPase